MAAIVGSLFVRWSRCTRHEMSAHEIIDLAADTEWFIDECLSAGWTDPVMTPLYANRCLDFIERYNTAREVNLPSGLGEMFVELRRIVALKLAGVRALGA